MNETPTLYEWAGGEEAIRRLMDCFYDRVERDQLLSPYFPGGVSEEHRAHVGIWWSEVLGGPARYTENLGGYENMLAHHRGLAVSNGSSFNPGETRGFGFFGGALQSLTQQNVYFMRQ